MKTFRSFITEKYSEEHAHRKLWNHFISHGKHGKEVRQAILDKEYDKALEIMSTEVQYSKTDPKHPLHFDNAKRGFSVKKGKQDTDLDGYHKELDDAVRGVHALASQKKLRGAVEGRHSARVTGGSDPNAKLSRTFKSGGGKNATPKGDLEIFNADNPKERRGISMKKGGGAQLASAESGEFLATYKAASKSYVQRFHGDKSKEERKRIQQDIMNRANRVADANVNMKTAGRDEKKALKVSAQDVLDGMHDNHPNLTRHVSQVSTSGDAKFGGRNAPGTAGIVLTGATKKSDATAKPAEQQASARPRQALPKGDNRPGNVKVDYKPTPQQQQAAPQQQEPTERQQKIMALRQQYAQQMMANQEAAAAQQQAQMQAAQQQAAKAAQSERERIASLPRRHQATALRNSQTRNSTSDQISQHMS